MNKQMICLKMKYKKENGYEQKTENGSRRPFI